MSSRNSPPFHRWRKYQNSKGYDFAVLDEASFSNHLFPVAGLVHQHVLAPDGSFVDNHFSPHGSSVNCLHVDYLRGFLVRNWGVRPAA